MANALYNSAKQSFITGGLNVSSDTIKAALTRASYSAAHDFYDDVSASTVGTPATLASKTVTNGVFDAADVTYTSVAAGAAITGIIIYKDTGVGSTSNLIAFIDTATGLPVTPNGGNITVAWNASGIFTL